MTARSLDEALADFLGTDRRHLLSFSRGSAALYTCLKALGIGRGDEVVITGYTCVVVANAVKFLGARCVYADIDGRTYATDIESARNAISPRTRAIVIQHTFGIPANGPAFRQLANEHGVALIEDCALTIGARYKNEVVGSFGDAAFWSGAWTKPVPSGRGGFLSIKDDSLLAEVEALHDSYPAQKALKDATTAVQIPLRRYVLRGQAKMAVKTLHRRLARSGVISGSPHGKEPPPECVGVQDDGFLGQCGRMKEAAWKWQLRHLERDFANSRRLSGFYADALPELGLRTVKLEPHEDARFSRYPVRVANKQRLLELAESAAVPIGNWMTEPLHQALAPRDVWNYVEGMCPIGERAGREVINLPTDNGVNLAVARRVIAFLREHARPPQQACEVPEADTQINPDDR